MERTQELFNEHYLTKKDLLHFLNVLTRFENTYGPKACWDLKPVLKKFVDGFSTSHSTKPLFKGIDARVLILAVAGQYEDETKSLVVRRHDCTSIHCVNPNHYYFGTKQDVCYERGWRKKSKVTPELVQELRNKHDSEKISFTALAKSYKLPYHVVRNICQYISYV